MYTSEVKVQLFFELNQLAEGLNVLFESSNAARISDGATPPRIKTIVFLF